MKKLTSKEIWITQGFVQIQAYIYGFHPTPEKGELIACYTKKDEETGLLENMIFATVA